MILYAVLGTMVHGGSISANLHFWPCIVKLGTYKLKSTHAVPMSVVLGPLCQKHRYIGMQISIDNFIFK